MPTFPSQPRIHDPCAANARISLSSLPYEVLLTICRWSRSRDLVSLAKTCRHIGFIAEDFLYQKDLLKRPRNPAALCWAVTRGLLPTLDKLLTSNDHVSWEFLDLGINDRAIFELSYDVNKAKCRRGGNRAVASRLDRAVIKQSQEEMSLYWPSTLHFPQTNLHDARQTLLLNSQSGLHIAAAHGFTRIVGRLADAGADLEKLATVTGSLLETEVRFITALGVALMNSQTSAALMLLMKGAGQTVLFDKDCNPIYSALHLAAFFNHADLVKKLITDYNAYASWSGPHGVLPIHLAAACNPPAIGSLRLLLDSGSPINDRLSIGGYLDSGSTILHLLPFIPDESQLINIMSMLRRAGADIHVRTDKKETLLQYAVFFRKLKMVQYLLEHGQNPNRPSGLRIWTPLQSLAHDDVERPPFPGFLGWPAISVQDTSLECVRLLLNAGAHVKLKTLEAFLRSGRGEIASALLPRLVDPPNVESYWPTEFAQKVLSERPTFKMSDFCQDTAEPRPVFKFLVKHFPPRPEPNLYQAWRKLIIQLASTDMIELRYIQQFLEDTAGLRVKSTTDGSDVLMNVLGNTAYMHGYHRTLLERFVEADFDPKAADDYGNTYIHYVTRNTSIPKADFAAVLQRLVEKGVDINARNRWGLTALHWGFKDWKWPYILQLKHESRRMRVLLTHGARV
ncbi:serine/threonine-protein phosphatase 6 regulatory ankyrin repeat subunit A-like [Paramyrothecium foliicola]|nr:serine/threonine-protein phosphatase 6 regulatory ankyrin repeat subunit A-like [Paramyrothecium foliicola]